MQIVIIILLLVLSNSYSQSVVLNEIMSSNLTIFQDIDGDNEDWLEICNLHDTLINQKGFIISDDISNNQKWTFPDVSLASHTYLLFLDVSEPTTAFTLYASP